MRIADEVRVDIDAGGSVSKCLGREVEEEKGRTRGKEIHSRPDVVDHHRNPQAMFIAAQDMLQQRRYTTSLKKKPETKITSH